MSDLQGKDTLEVHEMLSLILQARKLGTTY
jgi:hypothetical protein